MVKKYTLSDASTRMNFNTREPSCKVGYESGHPFETNIPTNMRETVQHNGMQTGIAS
jgi:hypothetical protein